jgi:hypothetical protein
MPAEFIPKALPYLERLQKVQRILRAATFRTDQRLAIRELCEALNEITTALLERELGLEPPPAAEASDQPASK